MTNTEKLKLIDKMLQDAYDSDYKTEAYKALCNAIVEVIYFGAGEVNE